MAQTKSKTTAKQTVKSAAAAVHPRAYARPSAYATGQEWLSQQLRNLDDVVDTSLACAKADPSEAAYAHPIVLRAIELGAKLRGLLD